MGWAGPVCPRVLARSRYLDMSPSIPVPCSWCHQGHRPPPQPGTCHSSSWAQLKPPQPQSRTPRDGLIRGDAPREVSPREDALCGALVPAGAGGDGDTPLPGPAFALGAVWVSTKQDKWTEQPVLVLPWGCPARAALAPAPCPQPEFPKQGESCVSRVSLRVPGDEPCCHMGPVSYPGDVLGLGHCWGPGCHSPFLGSHMSWSPWLPRL